MEAANNDGVGLVLLCAVGGIGGPLVDRLSVLSASTGVGVEVEWVDCGGAMLVRTPCVVPLSVRIGVSVCE